MKPSIRLLFTLGIQSLCLRGLFLCLAASGCAYHNDWVREPFGPGTGPSIENCCYPGPGCGGCGGCVETGCCGVDCCEVECGGCEVGCGPACCPPAGCCETGCVPPATLCSTPDRTSRASRPRTGGTSRPTLLGLRFTRFRRLRMQPRRVRRTLSGRFPRRSAGRVRPVRLPRELHRRMLRMWWAGLPAPSRLRRWMLGLHDRHTDCRISGRR